MERVVEELQYSSENLTWVTGQVISLRIATVASEAAAGAACQQSTEPQKYARDRTKT